VGFSTGSDPAWTAPAGSSTRRSADWLCNKFFVGLSKGGQPFNFVLFRPRKSTINLEIKLDETEEIDAKIEQAGIEALDYDARWGRYRLTLHKDDLTKHRTLLKELLQAAYQSRSA